MCIRDSYWGSVSVPSTHLRERANSLYTRISGGHVTREVVCHGVDQPQLGTIDISRYTSEETLAREWQSIWRTQWLLAGLASDVAEPGDFFVFEIGPEQILITRSPQGAIRGFYNVCQHRGNRLVNESRGKAQDFRCLYHAWTYDLEGALKGVPGLANFPSDPRPTRYLRPVALEVWNGLIFIHLGESPVSLADFLGPLAIQLQGYRFDRMTLVEDQTVDIACNWKTVVDNFSELYHVDFLHPQHQRMVDCQNDLVRLYQGGHTGVEVPGATVNPKFPIPLEPTDIQTMQLRQVGLNPDDFVGRVMDIRHAIQARKRDAGDDLGFDYSGLEDHQLTDVWQYNLFPNAILSFTPEHLWILRPRPHSTEPNRCWFDKISLLMFPKAKADVQHIGGMTRHAAVTMPDARPNHDVFNASAVKNAEKSMTDTIDQDISLLEEVQAGMKSEGLRDMVLGHDEMRMQHFHNHWSSLMG